LSLPGTRGKVSRVNEIKVRFWDEKGKENVIIAKMLASRIVLHEIDHLDGILFIDKLENT
jgi:peptide deformylase